MIGFVWFSPKGPVWQRTFVKQLHNRVPTWACDWAQPHLETCSICILPLQTPGDRVCGDTASQRWHWKLTHKLVFIPPSLLPLFFHYCSSPLPPHLSHGFTTSQFMQRREREWNPTWKFLHLITICIYVFTVCSWGCCVRQHIDF